MSRPTCRHRPRHPTAAISACPTNRGLPRRWDPALAASRVEDEGDLHVDLVLRDPAVPELDPLLLDPGRGDPAQGPGGALQPLPDRVLEALARGGGDLADA